MNLKKHIKLKNKGQGFYSEEEKALYSSLYKQVQANATAQSDVAVKRKAKIYQILSTMAPVAIALVITLTCIFTVRQSVSDVFYSDENIVRELAEYTNIQADVKNISFDTIKDDIIQIDRTFDIKSNDKLYYTITARVGLGTIELIVVINERYNYDFKILNETYVSFSEYSIAYNYTDVLSSMGLPAMEYRGYIRVQTETVYFDYTQVPALGDEAFFESIQEIIQVK